MLRWLVVLVLSGNMLAAFWFYSLREFRNEVNPLTKDSKEKPALFLLGELSETTFTVQAGCLLFGIFTDLRAAMEVRAGIARLGVDASLVRETTAIGADYWVFIPDDVLAAEIGSVLLELRASMGSSVELTEGERARVISVGVYSDRDVAEIQVSRLKALGYDAYIDEIPQLTHAFWLGVDGREQEIMNAFDWKPGGGQKITTKKVQMPCERVASPSMFP